jgi:hypothetical protein
MRLKEKFRSQAFDQIVEIRAPNLRLEDIGRASSIKLLVLRSCGNHYHEITAQGLEKDLKKFGCSICKGHLGRGAPRRASDYEKRANGCIRQVFPAAKVITESRCLDGFKQGAMDFLIEYQNSNNDKTQVLVEVDGPQHFKGRHHKTTSLEQREVDRRKDDLSFDGNRWLVRLHYNDDKRWIKSLELAKHRAEKGRYDAFILYGISYKPLTNRYKRKLPLHARGGDAQVLGRVTRSTGRRLNDEQPERRRYPRRTQEVSPHGHQAR